MKTPRSHAVEILLVPFVGTMITFVAEIILELILPTRNRDGLFALSPVWVVPAVVASIVAYLRNRRGLPISALFVWVLPAIVFYWAYLDLGQPGNPDHHPWRELIGSDCGSSECLYQLFATTPLVFSVAYSLTSLFVLVLGRSRSQDNARTIAGRGAPS